PAARVDLRRAAAGPHGHLVARARRHRRRGGRRRPRPGRAAGPPARGRRPRRAAGRRARRRGRRPRGGPRLGVTGGAGPPPRRRGVGRPAPAQLPRKTVWAVTWKSIAPGPSCSLNAPEPERLMPPNGALAAVPTVGRLMRHMPARISAAKRWAAARLVVQQAAVSP